MNGIPIAFRWTPIGCFLLSAWLSLPCRAHEDTQTHSRLSVGAILFLDQGFAEDGSLFSPQARQRLVDGSIHEDDTPNYLHHFFNPKTGRALNPLADTAPQRASDYWASALQQYRSGDSLAAASDLGHVLHLLQDMTSPAHVHLDNHGQVFLGHCEGDGDDFEVWGYCAETGINAILQYVTSTDVQNSVIQPALSIGLRQIFDNQPQRAARVSGDVNTGYTFVRGLANQVYDFTTFQVTLRDTFNGNDGGGGELKLMFPGLEETTVPAAWWIPECGYSQGECSYTTPTAFNESWWIMPGCSQTLEDFGTVYLVEGQAYIENTGGGSGNSFDILETLVPARYDRTWFIRRYGSSVNSGRSMLRIYGDVLYPAAVAYGAGLLQAFLDEAIMPKPVTAPPTQLTGAAVQLNGQVRPNGESASAWFEWGAGAALENPTGEQPVGAGQNPVNVSATITGLTPDRVYSYRIVSRNRFGVRYGTNQTFRTPALLVTSNAPNAWQITDRSTGSFLSYTTNLTDPLPQAAAANGWRYSLTARMVDDFGGSKTMTFLYGASATSRFLVWWDFDESGNLTAEIENGAREVVATNGLDAALYHTHEIVYTNGTASYWFDGRRIGELPGVSAPNTPAGQVYWGSGSSAGLGQMNFSDLRFEITGQGVVASYHAGKANNQVVAPNPVTQGWTATPAAPQLPNAFTPVSPDFEPYLPLVETLAASDVRDGSARLQGRADPRGPLALGWFEWGPSTGSGQAASVNYSNATPPRPIGTGFGWRNVSEELVGLAPDQMYHFRFVASNDVTVVFGGDRTLVMERPLAILSAEMASPGRFRLQYAGKPGTAYRVERSTDLSGWTSIGQGIEIQGSPGLFEFVDVAVPSAGGYYRIRSLPPP